MKAKKGLDRLARKPEARREAWFLRGGTKAMEKDQITEIYFVDKIDNI